jgi:hypothetical protein
MIENDEQFVMTCFAQLNEMTKKMHNFELQEYAKGHYFSNGIEVILSTIKCDLKYSHLEQREARLKSF